jgi:hypothetical protein
MKFSTRNTLQVQRTSIAGLCAALVPTAMFCAAAAIAQRPVNAGAGSLVELAFMPAPVDVVVESSSSATATAELPEDPSVAMVEAGDPAPAQMTPQGATKAGPVAPKYTKYISWGYTAQPITTKDKVIIGARDLYSPFSFLGELASAGYAHVTNGEPNYGTDKGAFGERLGAAVLRDSSEGVFTDMVFAPLLHEDPRYFAEGPTYNVFHRALYAVTRPLITRTDSGKSSVNGAMLIGYAVASAASYSYYPKINQNFHDTVDWKARRSGFW